MHRLLTSNLESLRELCRKHRVKNLWLFGSAVRDDFDPARSDLDFLVEFEPQERNGFDDVYFRLEDDLKKLFNRDIDLIERHVIEQSKNPYRRESILESPELLYAA
jgi:predicted nucleotidyltransferase